MMTGLFQDDKFATNMFLFAYTTDHELYIITVLHIITVKAYFNVDQHYSLQMLYSTH